MSADSHTVCPKCHPDMLDYTGPEGYPLVAAGVVDHMAEERGYDRSVRENIDYYLLARDHELILVFDYTADCWTCAWHFETLHETPVPVEQPPRVVRSTPHPLGLPDDFKQEP